MAWVKIAGSGASTVWLNDETGEQYVGSAPPRQRQRRVGPRDPEGTERPTGGPGDILKLNTGRYLDGSTGLVWVLTPSGEWYNTGGGMDPGEYVIDNTPYDPGDEITLPEGGAFDDIEVEDSGSGGGVRRSGATGPTYVKPDERLVREAVRATLVNLTGRVDQARIDMLVDAWFQADKRNFSEKTQDIDPMESVKDKIRLYDDYQRIHKLRPEEIQEDEWVSSRQAALIRAGLTEEQAIELGIQGATTGMTTQQVVESGQVSELARTGQARFGLEASIARAARAAFRTIR